MGAENKIGQAFQNFVHQITQLQARYDDMTQAIVERITTTPSIHNVADYTLAFDIDEETTKSGNPCRIEYLLSQVRTQCAGSQFSAEIAGWPQITGGERRKRSIFRWQEQTNQLVGMMIDDFGVEQTQDFLYSLGKVVIDGLQNGLKPSQIAPRLGAENTFVAFVGRNHSKLDL